MHAFNFVVNNIYFLLVPELSYLIDLFFENMVVSQLVSQSISDISQSSVT